MLRLALALLGALVLPARATLTPYPAPAGLAPSPHYRVQLAQDGKTAGSFVYWSAAKKPDTNVSQSASWTSFDFTGRVTVRVTALGQPFARVRVLPSSRQITPRIEAPGVVAFEIDRPGQFSVEFDESVAHNLFVFANPPEANPPAKDDPRVLFFGPGVHDLGEKFIEPAAGQTVYLAAGAYVKARLRATDAANVTLRGRGILSGENLPANPPGTYTVPHLVHLDNRCARAVIEGVTLVNSPHYNLLAQGADSVVRNLKAIGWYYGTDGIGTGPRGLVEDCFLKCNDDALKIYAGGMVVRRCVIWQLENGAPFQFSWNLNTDQRGFRVSDCDIIRVDHRTDANNRAIFNSIHGGSGHLHDYVFEDIRIENAKFRFMLLTLKKTSWSKAKEWGSISGVVLRNVTADGPFAHRSFIGSDNPAGRISDITFENVRVGGRLITHAADLSLDADPATTAGIRFPP